MNLLNNPHLLVPFLTYLITQSIKMFLKASKGDFNWRYMFASGDMPSVHSAVSVSLVVSLAIVEGVGTPIFALGFVWASFIIYDSLNVRRAVGEQGSIIVQLVELTKAPKDQRDVMKVREVLGHNPLEVLAGVIAGLSISTVLLYNYWPDWLKEQFADVTKVELIIFYAFFAVALVSGFAVRAWLLRDGGKRLPSSKRVKRATGSWLIWPGVLGLMLSVLQDQSIRFFTHPWMIYSVVIWIVVGVFVLRFKLLKGVSGALAQESDHFKKVKKQERKHRSKKKQKRKK